MKIYQIVATDSCNCIGGDNNLLWKQKADMQFFRRKTTDNTVLMGRKTYESMGSKPLKNRLNIVVTSSVGNLVKTDENGTIFVGDILTAIDVAKKHKKGDLYIIGGGQIYKQTQGLCDMIFLTKIYANVDGDTWYPEIQNFSSSFSSGRVPKDENNQYDYEFFEYCIK